MDTVFAEKPFKIVLPEGAVVPPLHRAISLSGQYMGPTEYHRFNVFFSETTDEPGPETPAFGVEAADAYEALKQAIDALEVGMTLEDGKGGFIHFRNLPSTCIRVRYKGPVPPVPPET